MAAVEVTISGVLYDKIARTTQPVVLIGEASLTGVGIGGGPVIPPPVKPPEPPLGIWPGPGDPDFPGDGKPPRPPVGIWPGPGDPDFPGGGRPPIVPPDQLPPAPNPGDPTTPLPPPAGSSGWPTQPIVPPPFIIVNYPGIGPVVVAPPATSATTPPA